MIDDDTLVNEDLLDEKDTKNSFFNLLSNEKSLKNVFILSEILNSKKFEDE